MNYYKSIKKKNNYENKPNKNRKIQLLDCCRGGVVINIKICVMKDLNYYKNNAEEDYKGAPISVLRYINELEKQQERMYNEEDMYEYGIYYKNSLINTPLNILSPKEWFEQIKKK